MDTATVKQIVEEEMKKHTHFVRAAAEKIWRASPTSHFSNDEYLLHRENCSAIKQHFPATASIPKSTLALLPLPDHPGRPILRSGNTDGCPACDIRIWEDCLKKAQVASKSE
jgi:hypothetical protein